jgi:predicted acyl esterase
MNNSVDVNYSKIKVPVYAISGHADCWPNTVSRLLKNLDVPTRGLQGPWCHRYPHLGIPGPTVDFLPDAVRWFDHWLKEKETGVMDEAKYQVYLQDTVKPKTYYDSRPGRWIGLSSWPSEQVETKCFYLNQEGLSFKKIPNQAMKILSPQTVGQFSGEYMPWFAFGVSEELPGNQNIEDSGSLVFDTETLEIPLEILGNASLALHLSSDQPQGLVAVRLCDLRPDGSSTLITRGILNLSQRNGKSNPEAMIPGEFEEVIVELNHVGYIVPKGHKLRLAVSTSYWPIAWPAPTNTCLTINSDLSLLKLPVLGKNVSTEVIKEFIKNNIPEEDPTITIREFNQNRHSSFDEKRNVNVMEIKADNGKIRIKESGMEMGSKSLHRFSISESDPLSACAEYEWEWEYGRGNWQTKTHTYTKITSDLNHFYLYAVLIAWEDNKQVFKKVWDEQFKRDHF